MKILAIDTSCDETSVAVTDGRKVISNVVYSQVILHKEFGGVMPSVAKRAHQERIDWVVNEALQRPKLNMEHIGAIAVTRGPGLAIALEVGISKAIQLAQEWHKPLLAINHMEGHIYSSFVQNSHGNPAREIVFPYLVLLVSGGHTELVHFTNHLTYQIVGETLDDAAGEALDKAARMLGFGYPGGPIIERLAAEVNNEDKYHFTRPMLRSENLDFSFSGLKTAFLYFMRKMSEDDKQKELRYLASSFQEAVFQTLIFKTEKAIKQVGTSKILLGGGVAVNQRLRQLVKNKAKEYNGQVHFPTYKYLNFDNAAMIGVAAHYRAQQLQFVKNFSDMDRIPRWSLHSVSNMVQ